MSDNGSVVIGGLVGFWLTSKAIDLLFIASGKQWQNGKCGSFNRRLRDNA